MVTVVKPKGKEDDLAANFLLWDSEDFNDCVFPRPPSNLEEASNRTNLVLRGKDDQKFLVS